MKKIIFLLISVVLFTGCKDETDISAIGTSASGTVDEINTNIRALQNLIEAQSQGKSVTSCIKISSSCFNVELEDGNSFSIFTSISPIGNADSKAYVPSLSALKSGTSYYWTIDGSFLFLSGKNRKVSEGSAPVVSIDKNGYWTLSCDSETLQLDRKAENGTVESLFTGVDTSTTGSVVFTLSDSPSSITLPIKSESSGINPISPTGQLRRPITPEHPAWLIHIDTWCTPDPQAIIDMIPSDILPYVIFNISLSVSRDDEDNFNNVANGYETAKSWLRTCAANNVWAMVQGASGGFCHWPDFSDYSQFEGSLFEEFYRDYPNFLGFNYAEQGWGFDDNSSTYDERLQHFACLMQLSHEYGGYLVVSFLNPSGAASNSGVAMIKRSSNFADACRRYPENFIACEKFTQPYGFFDMESTTMGLFVSGFAGNYGMRFDECSWLKKGDPNWSNSPNWNGGNCWNGDNEFPVAAGAIPFIEHTMLTGQTVYDGPELIWQQCFKEVSSSDAGDGYRKRNWDMFPQFRNISMDIYRKIIDGTIRILSRKEVIDRTKVVVVNDIAPTGTNYDPGYSAPANLFRGLYLMDEDGIQTSHRLFFKKTGRYPAIPTVAELADNLAKTFQRQIPASQFNSGGTWGDIDTKKNNFDSMFSEEYTSNGMYAARHENSWVAYNCYKDPKTADIPFKYNTCEKMELTFGKYSVAAIREYSDKVNFYITNYTEIGTSVTDIIKIYGSTSRPSYTYTNRVAGNPCTVTDLWEGGVLTVTVKHNGALDLSINCSGNATERETAYTPSVVTSPVSPSVYEGPRQYEAEYFQYRNISSVVKNAIKTQGSFKDYTALGYVDFGTRSDASLRFCVKVDRAGFYSFRIRYCAPDATINTVSLYVNGDKISTPDFAQTSVGYSPWQTLSVGTVYLNQGENEVTLTADRQAAGQLSIDNVIIAQ